MFLKRFVRVLEVEKNAFLQDVESSINSYVVRTGPQCIAIVEKERDVDGATRTVWTHQVYLDKNFKSVSSLPVILFENLPRFLKSEAARVSTPTENTPP